MDILGQILTGILFISTLALILNSTSRFLNLYRAWLYRTVSPKGIRRIEIIENSIFLSFIIILGTIIGLYTIYKLRLYQQTNLYKTLPNPPGKVRDWLENEVQEIQSSGKGVLLHNIPAEMTVENRETIEVRAARKLSLELTQRLEGNGDPEINQVKIQSTMGVILTGTKNYFDIDLRNTEEKLIQGDEFAEWVYDVVPEEAGTPDLYLTLYLVIETSQGRYKYEHPPIKKTVTVHPNPVATGTSFFKRNWKELIGFVIALGLIGASANWLKQKWERRKVPDEPSNMS